jgi:hypothetical protein
MIDRLVPVLVRSMKYSEQDISLLMGNVEEVSTRSSGYQGKCKRKDDALYL